MSRTQLLPRVRRLCLRLEQADEASPFGEPWFRVKGRMFCCFSSHESAPAIIVKVGIDDMPLFLEDPRFFRAPYIGRFGWVGLRLDSKLDWEELGSLIRESYARVKGGPRKKAAGRR